MAHSQLSSNLAPIKGRENPALGDIAFWRGLAFSMGHNILQDQSVIKYRRRNYRPNRRLNQLSSDLQLAHAQGMHQIGELSPLLVNFDHALGEFNAKSLNIVGRPSRRRYFQQQEVVKSPLRGIETRIRPKQANRRKLKRQQRSIACGFSFWSRDS